MTVFFSRFLIVITCIAFTSCEMIGQDPIIVPGYVSITSYSFMTDSLTQGANSEGFNDMWISNAGIAIGAVGLPSLLPIQQHGPTELRVDAGITRSGQDNERVPYPLVVTYSEIRNLQPSMIDTIKPVFRYLPGTIFKFIEDYDRLTRVFTFNPKYKKMGDTIVLVDDERAWRKFNKCGKIEFATDNTLIELITGDIELTNQYAPVYLEIDYKSNIALDIGYYFQTIAGNVGVRPVIYTFETKGGWRKLYINLTDEIRQFDAGTVYKIYIRLNNFDQIPAAIYIDNVKLVTL
jgi:hypothetical protein